MASVVLYFQIHQPCRLKRYSVFDTSHDYFDAPRNAGILHKVAERCYRPALQLLLDLAERHAGEHDPLRFALSVSGSAIDQFNQHTPDLLDLLARLAKTGACEFLAETYYHSLASLYSHGEFMAQVDLHSRRITELTGQVPRTFRNTELIYSNEIAQAISSLTDPAGKPRFDGMLAEGVDRILLGRSPDRVYRAYTAPSPPRPPLKLLLRNYRLSDDIAFRFSNRGWSEWPLTADKFAAWVSATGSHAICSLFMDLETFGEHQWADSGIFDFLAALPPALLARQNRFLTPAQAFQAAAQTPTFDSPRPISWADSERDATAWLGNAMQVNALQELYALERPIRQAATHPDSRRILEDWRRLTTSDHAYYMCTKYFSDGDVHKYFNPYESPYDAYINFTNVLDNLRARLASLGIPKAPVGIGA